MADFTNIYNSIFYDNTASGSGAPDIFVNDDRPTTMDIRRNMLQVPIDPAYGSANQVGVNPFFSDAASNDYTLQPSSLAVDPGANALFTDVSTVHAPAPTASNGTPHVP